MKFALSLSLALVSTCASAASLAKVYTKCSVANTAALTFDDGPYIYNQDVSNFFKQHNIKTTFFVNGNNWDCIYDPAQVANLQLAYADGHQIASHTWAHKDLTTLTWDQIHDEMYRVELAMQRIVGASPALMRPPYGSYNDLVREASKIRNQSLVLWDFDSGDSTGATTAQSNALYDSLAQQHPNNVLALNHETYSPTVHTILPHAYADLKAKGYKFVTVAECLNVKPYQWTAKAQKRTSAWTC